MRSASSQRQKTLLMVIAHPRQDSFNYAIADVVSQYAKDRGYRLFTHNLYADNFNPVLSAEESLAVHGKDSVHATDPLVRKYQQDLQDTDVLVVIHPNWWGKPPAMMAGWLDRVLAPGVAYKLSGGAAGTPENLLRLESVVITTGDTADEREQAVFGDPLAAIWNNCVLPYIGSVTSRRIHFSPVSASTDRQRQAWLKSVRSALLQHET